MAAATVAPPGKAGFWIRVVAFIVDAVIVGFVANLLNGLVSGGDEMTRRSGLSTLLGIAYYAYFWSASGEGRTLGMRLFKLKVVRTDGAPLTVGGALVRYVGLVVSFVCLFIGVVWVAFDADKQGWHDKIAGTYVVRTT